MPTVAEDVAFGLRRRGLSKAEIADRVERALRVVRAGRARATTPRTCSPAARSSCSRWPRCWSPSPTLLVMDEPTTLLDLRNAQHDRRAGRRARRSRWCWSPTTSTCSTGFDRVLVFDERPAGVRRRPPDAAVAHYRALMRA